MAVVVKVKPSVLKSARLRAGLSQSSLADYLKLKNINELIAWEETGIIRLTQLEKIANKAYVPVGSMFLPKLPEDKLPIPDFRRMPGSSGEDASPELIDTITYTQYRHDWYEDKMIQNQATPLEFVNTMTLHNTPKEVATSIRNYLNFEDRAFGNVYNWEESLRVFVKKIEEIGILVMRSGIVGNNTQRKLNVKEFRGFTLNNELSPLIFININDAKSAQMFTLAHELAHIWLGQSGVSNISFDESNEVEFFCNKVASEVLIPSNIFRADWNSEVKLNLLIERLSKSYKVSKVVILIKAFENNLINTNTFNRLYQAVTSKDYRRKTETTGGNFYFTQLTRLGKRFVNTVAREAYEGSTTFIEAFRLLGVKQSSTFETLAELAL